MSMTADGQLFSAVAFDCGYDQGYAEGQTAEREAIIKWLRKHGMRQTAMMLEKGEHLK
jgi:hypothetical protein